jgi:iron complex transport system permease protein
MKNTTSGKTGKKTVAASIMGGFGVLLFIVVFFFSVSTGSVGFSFTDVVRVLAGYLLGLGDTGDIPESLVTIIINVRLPRVILSALAGAALSISGAAMQGLLKNPLARYIRRSTGGGIASGFNLPFFPDLGLVFMSILFSFLSLILILTLTYKLDYNLSNQTIILNGVIFSMLASSITSLIVSLSGNNLKQYII